MNSEQRRPADWRIVWQMFYPCVISDLIDGCVEVIGHQEGNNGRIISAFITFALMYPFYLNRMRKQKVKTEVYHNTASDICKILIGAAAFSFMLNIVCWQLEKTGLLERVGFIPAISGTVGAASLFSGARWQQYILMCIAAPLREELLFRGIIFERLRQVLPFWWAAMGSSIFFGLIHGNIIQGIYAFFMGIVLAWLYEKRGRLYEPVLFHSVANLMSLVIQEVIINDFICM